MKTSQELQKIREDLKEEIELRHEKINNANNINIMVCGGTGCTSSKSSLIIENLKEEIKKINMQEKIKVVRTGCFGLCAAGPIVIIHPGEIFYSKVKPDDAHEIIKAIQENSIVARLLPTDIISNKIIRKLNESNFYKKQKRVTLKNCGLIDPENIDEYIALDGYKGLEKALTEMTPEDVIKEVKDAGIRGRGGAGFPTGMKWEFAAKSKSDIKYVCCNADEGDPGAFMDRSVLEGDPHSVIEALIIAGYAIGAHQGFIYIRAEYPIAVGRLKVAIKQAKDYGLIGKNIFGSGFDFDLDIRLGAGAFVCGEETALMRSIEGNRGEPRVKPPYPASKGLWDKPTILNNVETLSDIPNIILKGAKWFSGIGSEKSKGTKVFALGGKINNTGLVEVPMGTTLREIIYDIGGGIPNGKKFKAAQTGGPSGGCIPAELIDTTMDFDSLPAIGSMIGSGGLIVMDEDTCMVDIAKFFLEFTVNESCGKCPPCRIGTKRMLEILNKITSGKGTMEDLDKLEELANHIKVSSLCGLGMSAPNPVLSTLRYFRSEYEAHVKEKRCPAGVCKALLGYKINPDICKKCGLCAKNCPVGAISGDRETGYKINPEKCIKCGLCFSKCPFKAISK